LSGTKLKIIDGEAWARKQFCRDVSTLSDLTGSKTAGLLPEPGRCETYLNSLESFLQSDVPEPALNRGK
jgi:hypothetical protein